MNAHIRHIFLINIFCAFLLTPYVSQSQNNEDKMISGKLIKQDFISFEELVYSECIMTTKNGERRGWKHDKTSKLK